MGIRVLKLGGTTVADPTRLANVVAATVRAASQGPVVLVVSALAGTTDALLAAVERAEAGDSTGGGVVPRLAERHRRLLAAVASGQVATAGRGAIEDAERLLASGLDRLRQQLSAVASRRPLARGRGTAPPCPPAPTDVAIPTIIPDPSATTTATAPAACPPSQRAAIVGTGERVSAPIVAAALAAAGLPAVAVDAAELVRTRAHGPGGGPLDPMAADPDLEATGERLRAWHARLPAGVVPVVTGYVAGTPDGQPALLGRGASDLSAAVVAGALAAEELVIYTDVPGVMSADPRLVPRAVTLPRLGHAELTELALLGAKVVHPRTLEPLAGRGVAVWVRDSGDPDGAGTRVEVYWGDGNDAAGDRAGDDARFDRAGAGEARRDWPGDHRASGPHSGRDAGAASSSPAGARSVTVVAPVSLLVAEPGQSPTLALPPDLPRPLLVLGQLASRSAVSMVLRAADVPTVAARLGGELGATVEVRDDLAVVAVVGERLADGGVTRTLARAYAALGRAGVEVHLASVGASARSFAVVVGAAAARRAAGALHAELVVGESARARIPA